MSSWEVTVKDTSRQPTSLTRLEELLEYLTAGEGELQYDKEHDIIGWIQWTYNFLSARKDYHRKARIKTAMLERMAKSLLSKDELEQIDREAEGQLSNPELEPDEVPTRESLE